MTSSFPDQILPLPGSVETSRQVGFLFTYRVNSGTAFYIGYDDHYLQREQFELKDQVNITGTGFQ